MNKFDIYIILIIIIKVTFVILALSLAYMKHKKTSDKKTVEKIEFWKDRIEFIFISMMATLLIYLFYPRANRINLITSETKILLFLFGFILLFTAKWDIFFKESPIMKTIQSSIGNVGST